MAGDWIKIKTGIDRSMGLFSIMSDCGITADAALSCVYRVAAWFRESGKHGLIEGSPDIIDRKEECPGLSAAMIKAGWLTYENGRLRLEKYTDVSAIRKSLGSRIRKEVLDVAKCASCDAHDGLVIDHIIPISRGGSSDRENLQALCVSCNIRKGRKTMEEFCNDR